MEAARVEILNDTEWETIYKLYLETWNRTPEQQKWLHKANPNGKSILYGLYVDNELVATRALIPFYLKKGKQELLSYKSEDSFVKKSHRGKGYFRELNRKLSEVGNQLIWGFSDTEKVYRIPGFNSAHRIRPAFYSKAKLGRIWSASTINFKKKLFLSLISLKNISNDDVQTITIKEGFDPNVQQFYDHLSAKSEYYIPKMTDDIYTWQYETNPFISNAFCLSLYEGGVQQAIAFVSIEDNSALIDSIYFAFPMNQNKRKQLINALCMYLLKKDVLCICIWLFSTNKLARQNKILFKNAGFIAWRKGLYIGNNLPINGIQMSDIYFSGQFKVID